MAEKKKSLETKFSEMFKFNVDYLENLPGEQEFLPTGIQSLDEMFGGGFPRGWVTDLSGFEGAGKTRLALAVASLAIKNGIKVGWVDIEHRFPISWAVQLGLGEIKEIKGKKKFVPNELFLGPWVPPVCTPGNVGQMLMGLIAEGCGMVVADSTGMLTPAQAEIKDFSKTGTGKKSDEDPEAGGASWKMNEWSAVNRQWKEEMNLFETGFKWEGEFHNIRSANCGLVIISHLKKGQATNSYSKAPEVKSGGKGLDFAAGLTVKMSKGKISVEKVGGKDEYPIYQEVWVKTGKSNFCPPHQSASCFLYYDGRMLDSDNFVISLMVEKGYLTQGGAWFTISLPGETEIKVQGKDKALEIIRNSNILKEVAQSEEVKEDE